jgi:hypothetical protein
MTQALAIIKQALRESNLIAITADPTTDQISEGQVKLNQLIASVFGFEVGIQINDWPVGTNAGVEEFAVNWNRSAWSTPPQNVRLVGTSLEAEVISLPPFPDNGARIDLVDLTGTLSAHPITLDGNGKLIESAGSVVVALDGANIQWMYRADLGEWVRISIINLDTDELPFPLQFDAFFETRLAMRLNPRYGRSADPQTLDTLNRAESKLRATYRQTRAVRLDPAVTRRSLTGQQTISDLSPDKRPNSWMV